MRSSVLGIVAFSVLFACGDDAAPADGDGGRSGRDGGRPRDAGMLADGETPPDSGSNDGGALPTGDGCAPLPAAAGAVMRVGPSQATELPGIVRDAASGTTILLEDGTYRMSGDEASRRLQFRTDGVTMRSASGNPEAVVIDGEYMTNEIVAISASNVTIAELTITHAVDHAIHATAPSGGSSTTGTMIYRVRLLDNGEQFVKVNANGERTGWADEGTLACSYFELTDAGRPNIERSTGGCYTGGIDTHGGRGWVVRDNRFVDIYCAGEGLAEHAIHFWTGSRDTLVERNVISNCARGIGFGLVESGDERPYSDDPYPAVGYIGHYDGIIRNNVIYADIPWFDTGIELAQAHGTRLYHNTVYSTPAATGFFSSIDYRFSNTDVEIRNNITVRITQRDGATGNAASNAEGAESGWFVDPAAADLHLTASASMAIDRGEVVADAGTDIDGEMHDRGAPDLGADER